MSPRRAAVLTALLLMLGRATIALAAPVPPTTLIFDYRNADGVIFHLRFDGAGEGARYTASLREGERTSAVSGTLSASDWAALRKPMTTLIGTDMAQVVTKADAVYQITLRTSAQSQTARFASAVDARQKKLASYYEPPMLPGRIRAELVKKMTP